MRALQPINLLLILLLLLLCACVSSPKLQQPTLDTQLFSAMEIESAEQIFRLPHALVQQLDRYSRTKQDNETLATGILQLLLDNGDASLSYQSSVTLTAAQSYTQLNANCLSLSILSYSIAHYLGVDAQFQNVHIPEYWLQNRGYNLLTGHINVLLKAKTQPNRLTLTASKRVVIDFDPASRQQKFRTSTLKKQTVIAMFYNNKGAEALVQNQLNLAFNYFTAAIESDSQFSGAWGNLAVVYRQSGLLEHAEQAYNYAIMLKPDNNTALGNLALLYRQTGRETQARVILQQLASKRRSNPYYHLSLGNTAFTATQYHKAFKHFKTALKLSPDLHDGHFAIAKVYYIWGDLIRSKHHLSKARKHASFAHDKHRYQQKLQAMASLSAEQVQQFTH